MAWQLAGEASGGKGRCVGSLWVTIGPLRLTIGHQGVTIGHLRVTIGYLRVTMGHLRLTIGYLKATEVYIRVTLGHLRVTIGYFFYKSKQKANTTELHPKVRRTCIFSNASITWLLALSLPRQAVQAPASMCCTALMGLRNLVTPHRGHDTVRGSCTWAGSEVC